LLRVLSSLCRFKSFGDRHSSVQTAVTQQPFSETAGDSTIMACAQQHPWANCMRLQLGFAHLSRTASMVGNLISNFDFPPPSGGPYTRLCTGTTLLGVTKARFTSSNGCLHNTRLPAVGTSSTALALLPALLPPAFVASICGGSSTSRSVTGISDWLKRRYADFRPGMLTFSTS
jgi:hypothetical protein